MGGNRLDDVTFFTPPGPSPPLKRGEGNDSARPDKVSGEIASRAPEGLRVYAIGDVHGRADLLARLAQIIAADLAQRPCAAAVTVFVGDYVDRGPASRAVIERLSRQDFPTPIVALRGNHEDLMLQFIASPRAFDAWAINGGLMTLQSYGVDAGEEAQRGGLARVHAAFLAHLPKDHRRFLENLSLSVAYGDYFFCHAGVRPRRLLERQNPHDLMWIRDEFLNYRGSFGKVVVHGHTPVPKVENLDNRINLDTGAVKSGVLSAVALDGAERRFFDTARRGAVIPLAPL